MPTHNKPSEEADTALTRDDASKIDSSEANDNTENQLDVPGQGAVIELQRKDQPSHVAQDAAVTGKDHPERVSIEHGGQAGLEPTRYGDWEKKGRCTDF